MALRIIQLQSDFGFQNQTILTEIYGEQLVILVDSVENQRFPHFNKFLFVYAMVAYEESNWSKTIHIY